MDNVTYHLHIESVVMATPPEKFNPFHPHLKKVCILADKEWLKNRLIQKELCLSLFCLSVCHSVFI